MEEIELREALRQHVQIGEPPLGLTAADLLSQGRRQLRWRIGLSLGSGSAATAIAIIGALTLTPLGGSGLPALDNKDCSLPLATYSSESPGPHPSDLDPSHSPSPGSSASISPTDPPYQSSSPDPSGSANVPSVGPTESANVPSNGPSEGPDATFEVIFPTTTSMPFDAPMAHAATCYLAREVGALFPAATFLSPNGLVPPISMRGALWPLASPHPSQPQFVYTAAATAIEPNQASTICITITPSSAAAGVTSAAEGILTIVKVNTGKSLIEATVTDSRLTVEQLTKLASAPELDMFR